MLIKNSLKILSLAFGIILWVACNKNEPEEAYNPDTSYWSINQFIMDQYQLRVGSMNAMLKVVNLNGKKDSAYMKFDEVDWGNIFKIFGATDISSPKFYGKYKFDNFDDNFLEVSTLTYTALEPDLYVRRLDVNYDNITGKINSIYIETNTDDWFDQREQKLSYYVGDKIVVHEIENSKFSKDKDLIVTYEFR